MRLKDFYFLVLLALALLCLAGRAVFDVSSTLANFGDIYAYHYPLQHLTTSGIQSGKMPFWNPFIFSGIPHLANSQTAVFYPPAIVLRVFPLGYAFTLYVMGHLMLAGLGMHLWMRALKMEAGMCCLFAASFCLGPFLVCRISEGVPTLIASMAYVPWCWLALRSGRMGFLSGVWALQFLSGHPQFALINALGMALYAGAGVLNRRGASARVFLREGVIMTALCLVQWVTTAQFLSASNRSGIPEAFKTAYSMPPRALWTLIAPWAFGGPIAGDFASVPSVYFEMFTLYVGWVPLALALYGLYAAWTRPKEDGDTGARLGLGLVFVGVFLATGSHNPFIGWLTHLPVVGLSRVPARFGLLVVWGILMAGAAGWRRLCRTRPVPATVKAGLLLLVFLDLGWRTGRFVQAESPAPYLRPNPVMVRSLAGRPIRFATDPEVSNPNKAMLYRAMNVNGYDAFYLGSYTQYAARSEQGLAGDPSRTYIRRTDSPEMRRLGVAHYMSAERRAGEFVAVAEQMRLYAQAGAYPLAFFRGRDESPRGYWGKPALSMASPEHWTVRGETSSEESHLILSVPHYPGWRAFIDGLSVPISIHDGLLQAVALSGDRQPFRADFIFSPTGWPFLCAATVAAWMVWFLAVPRRLFA